MNASPHPEAAAPVVDRPRLVMFYSALSGHCRRAEGFLAQVLQRRHNHDTFSLQRVSIEARSDLAQRFKIDSVPTILVIEQRKIVRRITSISNCRDLEKELAPWLR